VPVSGDTIVVGSPLDVVDKGPPAGAAYVFERGAGDWGQTAELGLGAASPKDEFGYAGSISGDVLFATAPSEDGAGTDRGAAHVFGRDEGGEGAWGEARNLTASDGEDGDGFGWDVSVSGDTAVVSAIWEAGSGEQRGAAYVFELVPVQGGTD